MQATMSEHHRKLLGQYRDTLRVEEGIENAEEYLERYGSDSIPKLARELPAHIFARHFPENSQDIVISLTNPRTQSTAHHLTEGEAGRLAQAGMNVEQRAKISANYLPQYLERKYFQSLLKDIADASTDENLSEASSIEQYQQLDAAEAYRDEDGSGVDLDKGFYRDIYYTNYYKLATDKGSDIPRWGKNIARKAYFEELAIISPHVAFIGGYMAWEATKRNFGDQLVAHSDPEGMTVSAVHGHLFKAPNYYVVPIAHISHRGNGGQPWVDSRDQLQRTCRRLSEAGII